MNNYELADRAEAFASVLTCYMKSGFGQKLTKVPYDSLCKQYPVNATYGNSKYIGTNCFPEDCICWLKSLLCNATIDKRILYDDIKHSVLGDFTNVDFLKMLDKTKCLPKDAKRGYGLATKGHCGIALGNGRWIDANRDANQNGVKIHTTGIEIFTVAGKIDTIDYLDDVQVGDIIPMTVTKIENGIAYGQTNVGGKIVVGSKVTIDKGAKAGGLNKKYRGKPILPQYANGKYIDTVDELATHYGVEEAKLVGINTWVALTSLNLVE